MTTIYSQLQKALQQEQFVILATVINGLGLGKKLLILATGKTVGSVGSSPLDEQVIAHAQTLFKQQQSSRTTFTIDQESIELFFDVYPPPPKLIIIGAVHIAMPLITFAKTLGYHTIVIDARAMFATPERVGHADELIIQWPDEALQRLTIDEATCIVTLTHDEKLDNPALEVAVQSKARYIGALGARSTHAKRVKALQEKGITAEQLARIHAPIGLNIGSQGPEEIAIAIMAEIVANRHGMRSRRGS